jgi:hypothetical protein
VPSGEHRLEQYSDRLRTLPHVNPLAIRDRERKGEAAAMGGGGRARQNAIRSGIVVLGTAAFGYLSYRVGFKPYLDRAQEAMDSHHSSDDAATAAAIASAAAEHPDHAGGDGGLPPSRDPAVVLRD